MINTREKGVPFSKNQLQQNRYLGLIHHELLRFKSDCRLQDISLIEMCARVIKNRLRGQMRIVLKGLKVTRTKGKKQSNLQGFSRIRPKLLSTTL